MNGRQMTILGSLAEIVLSLLVSACGAGSLNGSQPRTIITSHQQGELPRILSDSIATFKALAERPGNIGMTGGLPIQPQHNQATPQNVLVFSDTDTDRESVNSSLGGMGCMFLSLNEAAST